VGIVLGAWWSYQVLGWGGFWVGPGRERRVVALADGDGVYSLGHRAGSSRTLSGVNLSLAIATFALTVLGTFFTRSGVLQSVHAFSSSTLDRC